MAVPTNFLACAIHALVLLTISALSNASSLGANYNSWLDGPNNSQQRHSTFMECLSFYNLEYISQNTTISPNANFTFSKLSTPYNLRLPYTPIAIIIPASPKDVSFALKCASKYDQKVAAKGGGHSYASMGLGGQNGSVVIDMVRFNKVEVDPTTQVAKVGAGVRLGNLATDLWQQGKRATPHGLCPGVGIGGHALHGGFGFTSRMWGTTLDNIIRLDIVLTNGTITKATSTINPELFWALRGAGHTFAVVTNFYLSTYPAPEIATTFSSTIMGSNGTSVAWRTATFLAMQEYALKQAPKELALRYLLIQEMTGINGVYWGPPSEYEKVIEPLAKQLREEFGVVLNITSQGWLETLGLLANGQTLVQPLEGYNEHDNFFTKSIVTSQRPDQILNATNLIPFFNYMANTTEPAQPWVFFVIADLYGGVHSKITNTLISSSSYAHRSALWTLQLYSNTNSQLNATYPTVAGISYMNGLVRSLTDTYTSGVPIRGYANYIDPTLTPEEAHDMYYGNSPWGGGPKVGDWEGLYDRLVRIKVAVDPGFVLFNPQTIGVRSK